MSDHEDDDLLGDELGIKPPSALKRFGIPTLLALVTIAGVGAVGQLTGAGWFGYRTWLHGPGDLYVLNLSETPYQVSVDGFEATDVPADGAQIITLVGGTSEVVVTTKDGEVVATHQITVDDHHALLKLDEVSCLAVVDTTPYYSGRQVDLNIVAKLPRDTDVHILDSANVVWPRKDFPLSLNPQYGPGRWTELVGCELLDDKDFLGGYLDLRLQERVQKAQEKQNTGPVKQTL